MAPRELRIAQLLDERLPRLQISAFHEPHGVEKRLVGGERGLAEIPNGREQFAAGKQLLAAALRLDDEQPATMAGLIDLLFGAFADSQRERSAGRLMKDQRRQSVVVLGLSATRHLLAVDRFEAELPLARR